MYHKLQQLVEKMQLLQKVPKPLQPKVQLLMNQKYLRRLRALTSRAQSNTNSVLLTKPLIPAVFHQTCI